MNFVKPVNSFDTLVDRSFIKTWEWNLCMKSLLSTIIGLEMIAKSAVVYIDQGLLKLLYSLFLNPSLRKEDDFCY